MKRKLTRRETLAHLDAIIAAAPADGRAESATFLLRLKALRDVVATEDRDELTLAAINSSLFPGLKPESRRSTFSNFRTGLGNAAAVIGHELALIQPPVRGKAASQISLHFEGRPLPDNRETLTTHATAKLDQLVQTDPRIVPDVIRIFISFANADAKKVAEIKALLEATWGARRSHRVSFWVFNDPKNGGILAGENNLEEIRKAIASCPLALFLLTPSSCKSKFILDHELSAYFPNKPGKHPIFVNIRNCNPPAAHLPPALLDQFIFSYTEKSYEEMRDLTQREQFAAALNDHIEQLCRKHFSAPREETAPLQKGPRLPKDLLPDATLDFCEVDPQYHRNEQGVDAVNDLLAWAKNPDRAHYFALLGETGAGKSTTALLFARRINQEKNSIRAYLFDLRYANYDGLLERTDKRPSLDQIIESILRRHDITDLTPADYLRAVREEEAILIFDGLDEVFTSLNTSEQDSFMHQLLRALPIEIARRPGAGKLLFACRTAYFRSNEAERGGLTLHGREGLDFEEGKRASFELARMLPFTEEQIRAYFTANLPSIPFEDIWNLLERIHELRELATHPYLLDLIRKQIPSLNAKVERNETIRAVDLYAGFISDWSHERNLYHNVLQPEDKNELMELLAVHMWRHGRRSLPAREMERWLLDTLVLTPRWQLVYGDLLKPKSQESLLSDFRTASFVSRWEGDTFRFAHTSLQEYFLACHLARALENGDYSAWDIPEPSRETFDFLGQHLFTLTDRQLQKALASIAHLLSDCGKPENSRLNALRYHLQANAKVLPAPKEPTLDCIGLDLEGWKFHGTAEHPLIFGESTFGTAILLRTSFEHIRFASGADFRAAELRSACFFDCPLPNANFCGSLMDGAFFRECDLNGIQVDERCLTAPVLTHLCVGSPWLPPSPPEHPSALFVHGPHDSITSASISPDGKSIVSTSYGNSIRIWDAYTGRHLRVISGHTGAVNLASWSPDSRFIVSASDDKSLRIWEATSGKSVHTLCGHSDAVKSARWSPNGKRIVSASEDHTLRIWDAFTGSSVQTISGHSGNSDCATWSPDGRFVVSTSDDCTLRIWDASSGGVVQTLIGHTDSVTSVAWSPDGELIASTSYDETLRIWRASTGQSAHVLSQHTDTLICAAWSPDGKFLASGSEDYTIRIWDTSLGKPIRTIAGHTGYVNSTAWSPDGKFIVSGSDDGTVRIWDAFSGKFIRALAINADHFTAIKISPDGKFIAAASKDNALCIWDASTGKLVRSLVGHTDFVRQVDWSPDCSSIVSISNDKTLRIWNVHSGKQMQTLHGDTKRFTAATWSPDGKYIVSASLDRSLRILEASTGETIRTIWGSFRLITSTAWSPDGKFVAGKEYNGKTLCWDIRGKFVPLLPDSLQWFARQTNGFNGENLEAVGWTELHLRDGKRILREILPLPKGQSIVREPWDETEALKPREEVRWKFTHGPKDAWRWCHVVDPETGAIHPPELAAVPGAFSGPEVGPV